MRVLGFGLLVSTVVAAQPVPVERARRLDVEATAFLSTPERFGLCLAVHPAHPVEVDLCGSGDRNVAGVSSHGFYRARWLFPSRDDARRGFELSLGPGLGVRAMFFCPYGPCAVSVGPEALASIEAVDWLWPDLGLTLQGDLGVGVVWASAAPGVYRASFVVPARLTAGVAF